METYAMRPGFGLSPNRKTGTSFPQGISYPTLTPIRVQLGTADPTVSCFRIRICPLFARTDRGARCNLTGVRRLSPCDSHGVGLGPRTTGIRPQFRKSLQG